MAPNKFEGKVGISRTTGRWSPDTAKRQLPQHVKNISTKYQEATPDDLARGKDWYSTAHQIAHTLGRGDVSKGAGVLAALSPRTDWDKNVEGAHHIFKTGTAWHPAQTMDNNKKALRILQGEHPEKVLGGHKVLNFYRNIVNPDDTSAVTIDKHAHDIAKGVPPGYRRKTSADFGLSEVGRYNHFVEAYTRATHHVGESIPSTVQATTWITQRRQKGV